ncbi:hypothetical protein BDU57DRAFT_511489 [Ampelomyces quisqualis]|uniref:AA1-like domain-containing protein n=1 Tax=Ampelomyces quisqualis TaxID=50730 RepID=A0A6A5QSJ5_AMPQU|nr:hypothetical protein BDU57DRAFT_511489 [Ampelomyces quisqualis]
MVTLCITRLVTVALLAIFARPSNARWNVYSTFVRNYHPIRSGTTPPAPEDLGPAKPSYDVGNSGCFLPEKIDRYTRITFSKTALSTDRWASGPYCLHFSSDPCNKTEMIKSDEMWQYQNVHLSGKTKFHTTYAYEVCRSDTDAPCNWKGYKWTLGTCSNASYIIDDKDKDAHHYSLAWES